MEQKNFLTNKVIGAAIEIHRFLGPGLLESTYEKCLCFEMNLEKIQYQNQVTLPVIYKGVRLDCGYRMDIVIPEKLIIEVKAVEELQPIHAAQLLTYVKLSEINLGLLINFNVTLLKDGIKRMIL